ncbi:MAG: YbhB/YbcL family Raf kinase inhibitor-like protein [Myxococcales bacterium]|nr:YbhB/YbcL family Raf kinase inhibitor-like protein [Myxococcales bacterium]
MQLTSSAFVSHQPIPLTYTCDGDEVTPPLRWSNVPSEARSLVLLVDDPDAGRGVFTHWLVYNLTPGSELSEGARALPRGASEGMNDRGTVGYVGPCPPSGRHHYHFKIYALDTFINGLDSPTRDQIEAGMQGHILATGELVGTYQREAVEQ